MKITKSRLKQIIKEELKGREDLNESSMDNLRFYDVDYGRASDDYQDCEDRFSGKYAYLYDMCCNEEDPDFDPDSSECEDPEPDYDDSPAWLGEVDQQEQHLEEAKSARQAIEDIRKVLSRWPEDHEHTKELRAALSGIKF